MGDNNLDTSDASFLLDIAERMDATLDEVTDALAFLIAQTVSERRKESHKARPADERITLATYDPETMDVAELAAKFGISEKSIYGLAKKDALPIPTLRIGGAYRFSRRAYEELLSGERPRQQDAQQ